MKNVNEKLNKRNLKNKMEGSSSEEPSRKKKFLISVNVVGSAGPLRFVVDEEDEVSNVIHKALKTYVRERRCPVLGFDAYKFLLYCANSQSDALSPYEKIGNKNGRNFLLCKNQNLQMETNSGNHQKGGKFKAWIHKSLSFKI